MGREVLERVIKAVLEGKKRKRIPELVFKCVKLFMGRTDYDSGLSIGEVALALYGEDNPHTREKARRVITRTRKFLIHTFGIYLYATRGPKGYRYYIISPEDYEKVAEALAKVEQGLRKTKSRLKEALEETLRKLMEGGE